MEFWRDGRVFGYKRRNCGYVEFYLEKQRKEGVQL